MNTGKKLLRGSVMNAVNLVAQAAIAFLITPILVRSLGDRMYGVWILVMSFVGYYALLDLGISSSVSRYISRAVSRDDEKAINAVINTALLLFLSIGALCLASMLVLYLVCGSFIHDPEELPLFKKLVLLLGTLVAISFPVKVFQGILRAYLRYDLSVYASLSRAVVTNTLILCFVKSSSGILALAQITLGASLLEYALICLFAWKTFPRLRLSSQLFDKETRSHLLSYSWKSFVISLTQQIKFKVDSLVIASLLSVKLVTYYSIGTRMMEYFVDIVGSSIGGQLMPIFSHYDAQEDHELLLRRFVNALRLSTVISVFCGASILFYGKDFILRWMGPNFASSYTILLILCIPFTISLMQTPCVGLLYGISKHQYIAFVNTGAALLNLSLSIVFAKHFGMYGVALGTAVEMSISYLIVWPIMVSRILKMPLNLYYLSALGWTSIKTAAPLILYFILIQRFLEPAYLRIFLLGSVQSLLFVPIAMYFVLGPEERELLIKAVSRKK